MAAFLVPRLGVGSRSWVGSENLTAAISETPINLCDHVSICCEAWDSNEGCKMPKPRLLLDIAMVPNTHFRNILRNVFSFELSSGALSDT